SGQSLRRKRACLQPGSQEPVAEENRGQEQRRPDADGCHVAEESDDEEHHADAGLLFGHARNRPLERLEQALEEVRVGEQRDGGASQQNEDQCSQKYHRFIPYRRQRAAPAADGCWLFLLGRALLARRAWERLVAVPAALTLGVDRDVQV